MAVITNKNNRSYKKDLNRQSLISTHIMGFTGNFGTCKVTIAPEEKGEVGWTIDASRVAYQISPDGTISLKVTQCENFGTGSEASSGALSCSTGVLFVGDNSSVYNGRYVKQEPKSAGVVEQEREAKRTKRNGGDRGHRSTHLSTQRAEDEDLMSDTASMSGDSLTEEGSSRTGDDSVTSASYSAMSESVTSAPLYALHSPRERKQPTGSGRRRIDDGVGKKTKTAGRAGGKGGTALELLPADDKKKRKKPRYMKLCSIAGCQRYSQGKTLESDQWGPRGYRCKAHGGGPRCSFPGCSKASQGGSVAADQYAPAGRRCALHGGKYKMCNVSGCVNSYFGKVKQADKYGTPGLRCEFHGGAAHLSKEYQTFLALLREKHGNEAFSQTNTAPSSVSVSTPAPPMSQQRFVTTTCPGGGAEDDDVVRRTKVESHPSGSGYSIPARYSAYSHPTPTKVEIKEEIVDVETEDASVAGESSRMSGRGHPGHPASSMPSSVIPARSSVAKPRPVKGGKRGKSTKKESLARVKEENQTISPKQK